MNRLGGWSRLAVGEFGGLLAFWLALHFCGLKVAILCTLIFVGADGLRRYHGGLAFPRAWMLSNGLALVFGMVDLLSAGPFMIRYEAVASNLITGAAFLIGSFGAKPVIQDIAEERQGFAFDPERQDLHSFFRAFTMFWATYFFVKAGVYMWLTETLPFERALVLRSLIGTVSMVVMVAISFRGREIFLFCRRLGLFQGPGARLDE